MVAAAVNIDEFASGGLRAAPDPPHEGSATGGEPAARRVAATAGAGAEGGVELAPGVTMPEAAVQFSFSRASGPGGQHVNKTSTQAELRLRLEDLERLGGLRPTALRRLERLAGPSRLTAAGELIITSGEHRSQRRNRQACLDRLRALLVEAIPEPKRRRKTKPSKGAIERRLQAKREQSEKKSQRQTKARKFPAD